MRPRVDAGSAADYTPPIRTLYRTLAAAAALWIATLGACAARAVPVEGPPSRDVERAVLRATAPEAPLRVVFDWRVQEREARFSGRGVARIQGPHHARLDLFGPRGESYLSAAVVDTDLRLPPEVTSAAIPPAPLLWSALGVLRPPPGASLVATDSEGGTTRLEYTEGDARWRFEIVDDELRNAEWVRGDGARYTVEVKEYGTLGIPREAVYRDWAAFTQLTLTLDEVEHAEPFPPETWWPDRD